MEKSFREVMESQGKTLKGIKFKDPKYLSLFSHEQLHSLMASASLGKDKTVDTKAFPGFESRAFPEFEVFDVFATEVESESMLVTGYDALLHDDNIISVVRKHFSSCGDVDDVLVLGQGLSLVSIRGDRATEKAMELNHGGCKCDVQGCKIVVEMVCPVNDFSVPGPLACGDFRLPEEFYHPVVPLIEEEVEDIFNPEIFTEGEWWKEGDEIGLNESSPLQEVVLE